MKTKHSLAPVLIFIGLAVLITACSAFGQTRWSDDELTTLKSLWIGSLPPLPPDPSNKYADNPEAAEFGQKLFFDTRFSSNGKVACARRWNHRSPHDDNYRHILQPLVFLGWPQRQSMGASTRPDGKRSGTW